MQEVEAVGKNDKNAQQGFMYRGIDSVMNAMQPLLAKHKIFVVPEVLEQQREERQTSRGGNLIYSICKIRFTFYAEDGSSVSAVTIGEGMDSGDKATNKAMSIAFKYALFQTFCIPTEEMPDPDGECHEVKAKPYICCICGKELTGYTAKNGERKTAADTAALSKKQFGRVLCLDCMKQAQDK
jgi:hypothetical protein